MKEKIAVKDSCEARRDFCPSCNSHFEMIRPSIKQVIITNHFRRDLKDEAEAERIVSDVLDCSELEFTELHKFEESVDGIMLFRAKKDGRHIVYCVDQEKRLIFLRVIRNFDVYKKFLEDKKTIKHMVKNA